MMRRSAARKFSDPVLAVMPFDDEEDALAIATTTSSAWPAESGHRDTIRARRVGAGNHHRHGVDQHLQAVLDLDAIWRPKNSGLGRERARIGVRAYMNQKSDDYDLSGRPHPWARAALAN